MLYNSFRPNTTGLIERLYRVYKIRRNTKIEYLFKTTPFFLDSRPGKKASSSLELKTGVNEQLVMLKGLYRPEQCK